MSIHLFLTFITSIHPYPYSSNTPPFSSKPDVHPPREWQRRHAEGALTHRAIHCHFFILFVPGLLSRMNTLTNAVPHSSPGVAGSQNSSDLLLAFLLSEKSPKLSRPVGNRDSSSWSPLLVVSIIMVDPSLTSTFC